MALLNRLRSVAAAVRECRPWVRAAIAGAAGAAATLALAPFHWVLVLLLILPVLVWLLDGTRSIGGAFATGWAFGVGYFAAGLYWVGNAFLVYADTVGWAAAPAVLLLAAGLAVFTGLAAVIYRLAARNQGSGRVVALAIAWTVTEWLRGHVLTGFPWNLIGYGWAGTSAMMQPAAVTGVYGVSFLTVLVFAMPAVLTDPIPARHRWRAVFAATACLGVLWAGGAMRLAMADAGQATDTRLRLVQPNIPQVAKWQSELADSHFAKHIAMSAQETGEPPDIVIWAESAVPYLLEREPQALEQIAAMLPDGAVLLTGATRATAPGEQPFRVWNSLEVVDSRGRIVGVYDKAHLVPFGEYVPMRDLFAFAKLTVGNTDFTPGPGPRTLQVPGVAPFSPLICYEGIFPGAVVDPSDRPAWLLNITNDGWYGISTGPHQHLAQARFRAVEEGLPLVRVANTGISAATDAYGRVVAEIPLGTSGVVDVELPAALAEPPPYARFGDGVLLGILILAALPLGVARIVQNAA